MPTPAKKSKLPLKFKSWSFSRWRDYKRCPAYASWKYLEKLGDGGTNAAMERGSAIHKQAELYTLGKLSRLPKELALFAQEFKHLRKVKAPAEDSWTFDPQWSSCAWNDWDRAWLRVKVDAHYFETPDGLVVIDHKTGKLRMSKAEEYRLQLELTALAGLKRFPDLNQVRAELWYLDEGVIYPEEPEPVSRRDEGKLTRVWERNAGQMLNATRFPATPNAECRWCEFRASNAGPCKHG